MSPCGGSSSVCSNDSCPSRSPKCLCGLPSVTRTSWTERNPYRRFRTCTGQLVYRCNFFKWIDVELPPRIARPLYEMKQRIRELETYIWELQCQQASGVQDGWPGKDHVEERTGSAKAHTTEIKGKEEELRRTKQELKLYRSVSFVLITIIVIFLGIIACG